MQNHEEAPLFQHRPYALRFSFFVDLFYYTQDSQLLMVLSQQVTCITLGIFFAYAYRDEIPIDDTDPCIRIKN